MCRSLNQARLVSFESGQSNMKSVVGDSFTLSIVHLTSSKNRQTENFEMRLDALENHAIGIVNLYNLLPVLLNSI